MKQTKAILFIPQSMQQAYPEVLEEVCNGCGTGGWKGSLVPDTMYLLSVRDACQIHDWMYYEGETIEDKDKADRAFLNNLIRIINAKSKSRILKYLRLRRAKKYYLAVKYLGGPAFWSDKNKSIEEKEVDYFYIDELF